MTRKSTSVNLEEDHVEWMNRENMNRSDFINELIEAYRNGGGVVEGTMNEFRKRELDTEIRSLQRQLELKKEEREELEGDITSSGEAKEQVLEEADEMLDQHQLSEDSNPAQFWADKADMELDAFLTEMWERKS